MDGLKYILTIAGSDSVGGAGIQADIKTIFSLGQYAASAITAITAQNTCGVRAIQAVDAKVLSAQIDAVLEDIPVDAIKIGMVYTKENVAAIRESLARNNYRGHLVLDPVLVATSGDMLAKADFLQSLKAELFQLCTVLTPNISEAEAISGMKISNIDDMVECGRRIVAECHCKNVLVKGGHSTGEKMTDILVCGDGSYKAFTAEKIDSQNTHGTGCTLSSAIATYLAMGFPLEEAVAQAKNYVYNAILAAKNAKVGHGHGSTNHFWGLERKGNK
ncbi:MAG: bifunctional hydroxymethylpyrimidine kinase/phosphomethylpyrimidine kinase [Bacteroidales bacterium]|nr:bifunctional hydroxymethylpyrimidine kinase/phosphomethylpyrimidine kinase [Bacteroidales bacterium]